MRSIKISRLPGRWALLVLLLRLPCSARPRCRGATGDNSWKWPVVQFVYMTMCVCRRLGRQSGSVDAGQVKYGCAWRRRRGRYFFRSLLLPFYFFPKNFPNPAALDCIQSGFSLVTRHPKCAGSGHPPTRCARGKKYMPNAAPVVKFTVEIPAGTSWV